jgi:hypothetical protein
MTFAATMKIILAFVMLLMSGLALAQDDPNWPPLNYLKQDYRSSTAVAYVRVTDAEVVNRIPGLEDWRVVGEVVEPFKGKLRKGDKLVYYHGAEAGFHRDLFLGEKIVFLQRNYHEKEKQWVYAAVENSTLPYNEDRVRKLRTIRHSAGTKRPSTKN